MLKDGEALEKIGPNTWKPLVLSGKTILLACNEKSSIKHHRITSP